MSNLTLHNGLTKLQAFSLWKFTSGKENVYRIFNHLGYSNDTANFLAFPHAGLYWLHM